MSLRLLSSWVFFLFISPIAVSGPTFALNFRAFAAFRLAAAELVLHEANGMGLLKAACGDQRSVKGVCYF
jgi:hypothetical protein